MILINHPSVLKSHCSFVSDHNLWVVMPFMVGGSCLHILKAAYSDGFEEDVIAIVLHDILKFGVFSSSWPYSSRCQSKYVNVPHRSNIFMLQRIPS